MNSFKSRSLCSLVTCIDWIFPSFSLSWRFKKAIWTWYWTRSIIFFCISFTLISGNTVILFTLIWGVSFELSSLSSIERSLNLSKTLKPSSTLPKTKDFWSGRSISLNAIEKMAWFDASNKVSPLASRFLTYKWPLRIFYYPNCWSVLTGSL